MCYGFFQTVLFHTVLGIEVEDGKTSWVAVNVKWSLSNESKQPGVKIQFFKSFQKQQNLTVQRSSQKLEAQVPTHNIKMYDKPFHPRTDYVFVIFCIFLILFA